MESGDEGVRLMQPAQEDLVGAERVGLAEAKANLSAIVSEVERTGTPCVIMRYNRPAVVIMSLSEEPSPASRAKGSLSAYADADMLAMESSAFERAMVAKHANAS